MSPEPRWMYYVSETSKPYIQLSRLHYFAGPNLLFWPCAWGLALSAIETGISPRTLAHQLWWYFVGSLVLHSVGATWNDICDKDLDGKVERTKNRPLVKGTVTVRSALWFLFPQILVLIFMLRLNNDLSFYIGMFNLFFWVPLYPLMKRITYWPQAWLGVAGNLGIYVADTSLTDSLRWPTFVLFIGAWCWCMHYDTVYGMMDARDDPAANIYSTALLFGKSTRSILLLFAIAFLACLLQVGISIGAGHLYYLFAVGFGGIHLMWQTFGVDFDSEESCFRVFGSNATQFGYFVFGGLMLEYWTKLTA